jgi:glycogen(starch) synthase
MGRPRPSDLLVTGSPTLLTHHEPLIAALGFELGVISAVEIEDPNPIPEFVYLAREALSGKVWPPTRRQVSAARTRYAIRASTFDRLSDISAGALATHGRGRFALQLFSRWSPALAHVTYPYGHYIDMTMAQVRRGWPSLAPFPSPFDYQIWLDREGRSYRRAARVFTFSEATRRSVIEDYGADPERVVTVGAAGHAERPGPKDRAYGSKTLVFDGSDFARNGGDRVIEAFRIVRESVPAANLVIVDGPAMDEPGVESIGCVSHETRTGLFDRADIALAPTRLDVFPEFVLEAMSRGVVPVLSDAESMNEMLCDGLEGYVVSPPSAENLAEHVIELLTNIESLSHMGARAQCRIATGWNWHTVAGKIVTSLEAGGYVYRSPHVRSFTPEVAYGCSS